jgi:hypothetical protein
MADLLDIWQVMTDIREPLADCIAFRLRNILHNTQHILMPLYFQHDFDRLAEFQIDDAIQNLDEWVVMPHWTRVTPPSRLVEHARMNLDACHVALEQHLAETQRRALDIVHRLPNMDPALLRDIVERTLPPTRPPISLNLKL